MAHRLSTLLDADRIFVFEGGRLVQTGRYAELNEQDGLFAKLALITVICRNRSLSQVRLAH